MRGNLSQSPEVGGSVQLEEEEASAGPPVTHQVPAEPQSTGLELRTTSSAGKGDMISR